MRRLLGDIDRLLRGGFTQRADLREGRIEAPVHRLVLGGLIFGASYGIFMGLFAAIGPNANFMQIFASAIKVPLLYLLTLAVTFPSLYVFSALSGSRLRILATLQLLLIAIGVNLTLLASLGPVTGFFTLSTESYPFMKLLNVVIFVIAGVAGLAFLQKALEHVFEDESQPGGGVAGDRARNVFRVWIVVYAIVGAQMGWILRPFIGSPHLGFQFFRPRESNFFEAIAQTLRDLLE